MGTYVLSIVQSVGYFLTLLHDLLLLFQPRDPRGAARQEPRGSDPSRHNRGEQVQAITANTLYRKFETNISRVETARPRSQFLHSVSVSDLYISTIGPPILLQQKVDRSWEYINRSQIHFLSHLLVLFRKRSEKRDEAFLHHGVSLHRQKSYILPQNVVTLRQP